MVSVNFEIRFEKALFKKVFISFESLGKILFKLLLIEFLKKNLTNQKIYDRMFKQSSEAVTQARQMAE